MHNIAGWLRAPPTYIRATFDGAARQFDRHLVDTLYCHIPDLLSSAVLERLPPARMDILGLGCGTGLCGGCLEQGGRHTQSPACVRKFAREHGLTGRDSRDLAIRKHGAQALPGRLLVLK